MKRAAAGLLLALAAAAANAEYASRAQVEAAARAAAQEAKAYADQAALTAGLQQAWTRSVAEPLLSEARMLRLLQRLREVPAPLAQTRSVVEALQRYSPQVYTDPVDPEQRRLQVPAFAITGAARATLHGWDSAAAQAAYRSALARADLDTLRAAENPAALAAVARSADTAALALLRSAGVQAAVVRRALFERLADPQLAQALLREPASPEGLRLIAGIDAVLDADAAFAVLSDPALDAGYVSAARLAIGRLLAQHVDARAYLLETLGDRWGASSAQALARAPDAQTVAALGEALTREALTREADGPRLRHALLALHLIGTPDAVRLLGDFAEDPQHPAALRAEIRSWLR